MSAVQTWVDTLNQARVVRVRVTASDLAPLVGDTEGLPDAVVQARAQKAALVWVKRRLDAEPRRNQEFAEKTGIGWLDKLVTAARLKELATVKIVKAGKSSGLRYDIGGLACTFYGRKILDGLGFSARRSSVDRDEFDRITHACARIKLKLPQVVQPTTTERFFSGELTP